MKNVKCCLKELYVILVWIYLFQINKCTCQSYPEEQNIMPYIQPSYGYNYGAAQPYYYPPYDTYYDSPDYQEWLNSYMNWLYMKRQYEDAARYHVHDHEYTNIMVTKPVVVQPEKPEYDQLLLKTLNKYNSILKKYYGHIKQLQKFILKQEDIGANHSRRKHTSQSKNEHPEAGQGKGDENPGIYNNYDVSTLKYDVYSSVTNFPRLFTKTDDKERFITKSTLIESNTEHNKNHDSSMCGDKFCVTEVSKLKKTDDINAEEDKPSHVTTMKDNLEITMVISDEHRNVVIDKTEKKDFTTTPVAKCENYCSTTAPQTFLTNKYTTKSYIDNIFTTCNKIYPGKYTDKILNDNTYQTIKTKEIRTGTESYAEIQNQNKQNNAVKICSGADCAKSSNVSDSFNKSNGGIIDKNGGIKSSPMIDDEDDDYLCNQAGTTMKSFTKCTSLSCCDKKTGYDSLCNLKDYLKYFYTTPSSVVSTTDSCNPEQMATTDLDTDVLVCRNCKELNEIRDMVKRLRLVGISFLDMGHLLLNEDYRYPIMPKFMDQVTKKP